ncbi:hypothetical protein Q5752_002453 [Cryptotrichosporon argae]
MPHSHHSHSGAYCRHARDTLAAVVAEAGRQGFAVFGLSEHAPRYRLEDLFPEEADLTPSDLEAAYLSFLSDAHALRARLLSSSSPSSPPAPSLLIGLESDYITSLDLTRTAALLADERVEYVVGSVHHVGGVSIDFDRPTWLRSVRDFDAAGGGATTMRATVGGVELAPALGLDGDGDGADDCLVDGHVPSLPRLGKWIAAYLDAQYDVLTSLEPEVVGHFDLCLLWTPGVSLADPALGHGVWEKVVRNVEFAVGYGALFECNAAALRKGWDTAYPSREVLRLVLARGGRLCLSDDSHGVSHVGLNYARLRAYLASERVEAVWHLVLASEARAGDVALGHRGRVRTRRVEGWEEGAFWDRRDDE